MFRMQVKIGADTPFQRDRMTITPHFSQQIGPVDAQPLCEDLANGISSWTGTTREVAVTASDAQGSKPVIPIGYHIVNEGAVPQTAIPREVALCLSYYAGSNRPRYRGRLYIPIGVVAGTTAQVRPTASHQQKVADLVNLFESLGGANIDWVVFSRVDNEPRKVTNWWVDNEWDTIRSRGLRAETRQVGTTSG